MAILGAGNDNINIDGGTSPIVDFGGDDTYTLLGSLSADVTLTDNSGGTVNLPAGLDVTSTSFLSDGVQFEINGFTVTIIGDPSLMTFVFGGTPLDPTAGTPLSFADTAVAFGTTLPAAGDPPNAGTNTGEINDDGTVGDSGLTPEEIYAEAAQAAQDALDAAADAQAAADAAEAEVVDQATAEAYLAAAQAAQDAANDAADAAQAAVDAAANTDDGDVDDAEAADFAADAAAAQATADAEVANAEQAVEDNTPNPGQNFILTTGQDVIPGMNGSEGTADNSGDDTIFGLIADNGFLAPPTDTFTLGDNLDAGDGSDLLNLTVGDNDETITLFTSILSNLEHVKFDITDEDQEEIDVNDTNNEIESVTLDFLNGDRGDDLEVDNVNPNAHMAVQNISDGDDQSIEFILNETSDPINGSALLYNVDNINVEVSPDESGDGTSSMDVFSVEFNMVMDSEGGETSFYTTDIEELNVWVSGDSELDAIGNYENEDGTEGPDPNNVNLTLDANLDVRFWDFSDDNVPALLNVSGSGNLHIDELDDGSSQFVLDSTMATGNVKIEQASNSFESFAAMFGIGDDRLIMEDGFDRDSTTADGGDGLDTFGGSLDDIEAASMDDGFGGQITNFEQLAIVEEVSENDAADIDVSNFDGIFKVETAGTEGPTDPTLPEIQTIDVTVMNDGDGGQILIDNGTGMINVPIAVGAMDDDEDVAANIAAESAAIIAAFNAIDPSEELVSVVVNPFDLSEVVFTYSDESGDITDQMDAMDDGSEVMVANAGESSAFAAGMAEVQTFRFANEDAQQSGSFTFAGVTIDVLVNDPIEDIVDAAIITLNAAIGGPDVDPRIASFGPGNNDRDIVITFRDDLDDNDVADLTFPDGEYEFIFGAGNVLVKRNGQSDDGTNGDGEEYSFEVGDADVDGGSFLVEGVPVDIPAGADGAAVGGAIVAALADIQAANPDVETITSNTVINGMGSTTTVTVVFKDNAGAQPDVTHVDNDATGFTFAEGTDQDGQIGDEGGILNIIDLPNEGMLTLVGDNDGEINVEVDGAGGNNSDEVSVMLGATGDGTDAVESEGDLNIHDVETINVMTAGPDVDDGPADFNLNADSATSIFVTGDFGLDFLDGALPFLTLLDATGVTGEEDNGSVEFTADDLDPGEDDPDVTLLGGAGNDQLIGADGDDVLEGNGGDDAIIGGLGGDGILGGSGEDELQGDEGDDNIDGGDDNDEIDGGAGGDILTGGSGGDIFVLDEGDSALPDSDTITDFSANTVLEDDDDASLGADGDADDRDGDIIDLTTFGPFADGIDVEVFANAADALTFINNGDFDDVLQVALDASTGDLRIEGAADNGIPSDLITLTGVTDIDEAAFLIA